MLPASYGSPLEVLPVLPETGSSLDSLVPQTALAAACATLLIVSILDVVLLKVECVYCVERVCMYLSMEVVLSSWNSSWLMRRGSDNIEPRRWTKHVLYGRGSACDDAMEGKEV